MNDSPALAGKYLTFKLRTESYGIDVLKVREIIRQTNITVMPQMPGHFCGVINLRGKIIPVMDLRKRFGVPAEDCGQTCIIVVQVRLSAAKVAPIGLVVDAVEEVVNFASDDIEPAPAVGGRPLADCVLGIAKVKGKVKTLLDIDGVVETDF